MKSYQRFLLQCGICFLLPPALLTGCSLVGLGIGAITDSKTTGGGEVGGWAELRTFERGTGIVLITQEGQRIEGDYLGVSELNRRDYDREYLAAIETLGVGNQFPMPADTITFEYFDAPGKRVRGLFRGVDPGTLVMWRPNKQFSLTGIRNLQNDSARALDLLALRSIAETGQLPYITRGVMVDRGRDTLDVPLSEILRIERDTGGNAALTGFLIGAAIDAVVIIVLVNEERQREESCNRAWGTSNHSGCHSSSAGT